MRKILFSGMALIMSLTFVAQGNQNYGKYGGNFFPQSPNATPFALYGKYPVNLYKGVPSINIPLFSTQVGKNEFNITLDYNVKSVKPETVPSWSGLGWQLSVGGAITRIVNGGVDEVYQSLQTPYNRYSYLDNFSTLDNSGWSSQAVMQSYYQSNLQPILTSLPGVVPDPDEFIINIAGITGSFYMNEKGKWIGRTKEGRIFKVEHLYKSDYVLNESTLLGANYIGQKNFYLKRILYGFTIKMDDGTKYTFGQDDNNIEFTSSSDSSDTNFNPHFIVSAWNIKEINYANGKKLKFNYERDKKAVFLINNAGNASYYSQGSSGLFNISNSSSGGSYYNSHINKINQVFLTKIEGEDFFVNFTRSLANQKEYKALDYPWGENGSAWILFYDHHITAYSNYKHWYKLDKITVTDKVGNQIKGIDFTFNNDPNDRLFLNKIGLNNTERYDFKYNAQKLPEYLSDAVDGWGYYNGSNFLGTVSINVDPAQLKNIFQNIYPNYKVPNLNLSKAATLEEITYPTGGKSYFTYELNDYSKYGDKDLSSTKLKLNNVVNTTAGGLRIHDIRSCDENNKCYKKSYSYLHDNGTSSGILPYRPIYVIEGGQSDINLNFWEFNMHSYQSLKDEDNSVGYSKVTEIDDNGGKKETYFTSFDQPENNDVMGLAYMGWAQPALFKQLPYTSFSLMRGKPQREVISTSSKKISETVYTYSQQTDYLRSYSFNSKQFGSAQPYGPFTDYSGVSYGALLDAHYVNFNSSFLSQKEIITDDVGIKENYSYNYTYNTPTNITKTNAGNTYETILSYASDVNNIAMLGNYMVGIPVIVTDKKNGNIYSKTQTNYPVSLPTAQTGSLLLPLSESSYNLQNNGTAQTEFFYGKYDDKGNVQEYTTKDGATTAIIWGYNKTKPIAKIEGATYPDPLNPKLTDIPQSLINTLLTSSYADAAAGPRNDESTGIIPALNTFRTDPALKNYQITTFSYDPLVGVRTITPPNGNIEYYKYDTANRLERILDGNNNIVKEFKYNYAPRKFYNVVKSGTFVKNNCPNYQSGTSYTYTVPAGKYSSYIDQLDADAQAQQEVDNNGQNAANNSESCYNNFCSIYPANYLTIYYSSFEQTSQNHIKATINFPTPANSGLNWTNGVNIGSLGISCAPTTGWRDITDVPATVGNSRWNIVIWAGGSVILYLKSGTPPTGGNTVNLNFEYDK